MNATTKTQLAKWGNSLAVRIPKRVVGSARLREGDEVTLAVGKDGAILMRPARRKYQLYELVSKITAGHRHEETDWGPQFGKEAWWPGFPPKQYPMCSPALPPLGF